MLLLDSLPYLIKRVHRSQWLPLYRLIKSDGNNVSTKIRRIQGDINKLAADLSTFIPKDKIIVKAPNNQIWLKGDYLHDLRDWFTVRGF
ncbi:hypothetical protein HK097_004153 [Rhizophlyctis rosea]|uniref:Large ribosomal subunit protein mL49 n=1 Tax=Rhizophlyctis rosea TaxID=64517 RepID=A0AAD5S420_9FUNG|nr:hypothetical protein HK097_004153 [Rhizophlyctis rosea]